MSAPQVMVPGPLKGPAETDVRAAYDVIEAHNKAIEDQKRNTMVQCTPCLNGPHRPQNKGCGAWTPVKDIVYIQTYYYIQPHGCTGGDYWATGEGNWDCPACGGRNRLYDKPEAAALKPYFKKVVRENGE